MSSLALARKYRPRNFSELMGQEHVVRAISHALETGRLHVAYLLTGTRGVGKTTIARIAKTQLRDRRYRHAALVASARLLDIAGRFPDLIELSMLRRTPASTTCARSSTTRYARRPPTATRCT